MADEIMQAPVPNFTQEEIDLAMDAAVGFLEMYFEEHLSGGNRKPKNSAHCARMVEYLAEKVAQQIIKEHAAGNTTY